MPRRALCLVILAIFAAVSAQTAMAQEFGNSPGELLNSFLFPVSSDGDLMEDRADEHAPAGLMGDHLHEPGEFMLEYKYMQMEMDGNRFGTTRVSDVAALDVTGIRFAATPTRMTMKMHMLHFMYGWTDNITLYVMPMFFEAEMDHLRRPGSPPATALGPTFTTLNSGFGDLVFGSVVNLLQTERGILILNAAWSAPTGNINSVTSVPTGQPGEFPYPMRRGSGSFNARPALTYKHYWEWWSAGVQGSANVPTHRNFSGYADGDEYRLNAWLSRVFGARKSGVLSFRVENVWRDNVSGADPQLNPRMISTANPFMRGGEWVNFGYGAIYQLPRGGRFNVELVQPVYQNLRGVQLETDLTVFASYSKAF